MKLSVIVPVYNAEAYLQRCLDSILGQTMNDLELILINDGSPDNSQAIIDAYKAKYPDLVTALTVDNGGQGRARNIGIGLAQGEYLGFVDSDDWIDERMYEKLLAAAESEGADVAVCAFTSCAADGSRQPMPAWREGIPLSAAGSASNKLFKRNTVGDIRFPEGLWYEDFSFSAQLLMKAGKVAYVPEGLYYYRQGQSSTMNNNNTRKNLDMIQILEGLKGPMLETGYRDSFEGFLINHLLLDTLNRIAVQDSPDKKEVAGKLRGYVRQNIPHLLSCESFKREPRNRRIVMLLNYYGLENLSQALLKAKRSMG